MTDKLPPNLLALFAPRPPLRWVEPPDYAPEKRKTAPIGGLVSFLPALEEYKQTDVYHPTESWLQRRDRKKQEKVEAVEALKTEAPKTYKPNEDPNIRGDAFKTLIVARLSYEADERDLEREFGRFGPVERIRVVKDVQADEKPGKKKKPHRGYAFVVFEREKDMRAALDQCDGIRIKDRRIKVDVERGRTVKDWKPRRLGGGLGGRGYTRAMAARPSGPGGFGGPGGFRGGHKGFDGGRGRGGFRGGFGGRGGGFRGGSDFGPRGGDRNGYGPPRDAPGGPGGFDRRNGDRFDRGGGAPDPGRGGRYESDRYGGRDGGRDGGGGGRYGGRDSGRQTGSNMEPIGNRSARDGGYRDREDRDRGDRGGDRDRGDRRDRDYDRPRDDDSRKRGYEGGGYEDPRKLRRY